MQPDKQITVDQLGAQVKAKFSQYASYSDTDVGNKMLEKYPVYKNSIIQTPEANKPDLLQRATDIVGSVFPGQKVGEAIGTLGGLGITAAKEKLGLAPKGSTAQYDTSAPSPLQVAGDVAQGALSVAAPSIGGGETALGRIGANAALGAGLGGTNAVAQGKDLKGVATDTAVGGAIGGGISAATEGATALLDKLPKWFTKAALPKLNDKNVDYALENTKIAAPKTLLSDSDKAVKNYSSQIDNILSHPQYATEVGSNPQIIGDVIKKMPNAELNDAKIVNILKQVAPKNKSLIDKIAEGTANLAEQNTLRQELDSATKKVFTDKPQLTFAKQIGHEIANALRSNVQTSAPETVPVFKEFTKELDLNQALAAAVKKGGGKALGLLDLMAASVGGTFGGVPGAAIGVGLEKAVRNPAVNLGIAKGAQALGKAAPAITAIGKAAKAPIVKAATNNL